MEAAEAAPGAMEAVEHMAVGARVAGTEEAMRMVAAVAVAGVALFPVGGEVALVVAAVAAVAVVLHPTWISCSP